MSSPRRCSPPVRPLPAFRRPAAFFAALFAFLLAPGALLRSGPAAAAPGPAARELRVELSFARDRLTVLPTTAFPRVAMTGLSSRTVGAGGWPEQAVWLAVPEGFEPAGAIVTGREPVDVPEISGSAVAAEAAALPAADSSPGETAGEIWMRGTRLAAVRVMPLAWDGARGVARLWTRVVVRMALRPAPTPPDLWVPERRGTRAEEEFRHLLAGLVANPEDLSAGAAGAGSAGPGRGGLTPQSWSGGAWSPLFSPSVDGSPVECVIITSEALAPEFERLAAWRTRTGTPTVIRTVEWICATWTEGVDPADRIRRFIKAAASRWGTQWILLGGDSDVVPARIAHSNYYGGEDIATDLYYQCLDGSWNGNGNDVFGEALVDNADLAPEVQVSRIPLSTPEGIRAVIDKTFRYERTPVRHADYVPTFLALAEVLLPSDWTPDDTLILDGTLLSEMAIDRLPDSFRVTRLYETWDDPAWGGLARPENRSSVIDSLNAGYGIVYHVGHGYRNNLSVGLGGQSILSSDADALTNADEPFLFYGINCNSAAFDYECIAEHFLANPDGGAMAYVGVTRYDFPSVLDGYQNGFFQHLFQGYTLAGAHTLSRLPYIIDSRSDGMHRWTQMALIAFGDPLLRIRSATPQTLTVSAPSVITAGGAVPVTVSAGGAPLSGARVTLYRAGELFVTDTTSAAGEVTLACSTESAGSVSLTVTSPNGVPWETEIPVVGPAAAPWLAVLGLTIDDAASGNGDGRLDPGETADLLFRIRNEGGAAASGITLTYSSASASLGVVHGVTQPSDLAPGAVDSTGGIERIRVTAAGGIAAPLDVPGSLLLAWTGGSRTAPVLLHLGSVSLWVASQTFADDPGGPGQDGVVAPGELVELRPTFLNRGLSDLPDVRAMLVCADPRVTLETATVTLGTLAAGEVATLPAPLAFRVTDAAAVPEIDLVLEGAGIEFDRRAVDLTPPGAVDGGGVLGESSPSSIRLSWTPVEASDLRGYALFRSTAAGGPFAPVNLVVENPMAVYEDVGLATFTRYYYRIAAQDRSGNLGPLSTAVALVTSFPAMTDWPLERSGGTPSSPVVHDLNGDGQLEILVGGQEIYAMHADGSEFHDGDQDARTLGILTRTTNAFFWTTPAVADVDGDGILEIAAAGFNTGKLYLFGVDGTILPGWPQVLGGASAPASEVAAWGSPLTVDVDGDGKMEIFICGGRYLHGYRYDGSEIRDGDANPATNGPLLDLGSLYNYGTPAAADFDHDSKPDIVVGARSGNLYLLHGDGTLFDGFPKSLGGAITGSPAIADLDQDGEPEMIFPVNGQSVVQAIDRAGTSPPGWPVAVNVNQDYDASPTVADLNGDSYPDVVMVGGNSSLRVWRGQDGVLFPGFPVTLNQLDPGRPASATRGTPCLGDVSGDGVPDIIVGNQAGTIFGLDLAGQLLPGFPLRASNSVEGGALLWDLDGDGYTNLLFGSVDGRVYGYNTPGIFSAGTCPWPMFRHDQSNSGYAGSALSTPVAPALAFFEIAAGPEGVALEWEPDRNGGPYAGWHVFRRGVEPDGGGGEEEERLTDRPLSDGGSRIRFVDGTAVPGERYFFQVAGIDRAGRLVRFAPAFFEVPAGVPPLRLQNAPNPFTETTLIHFTVPDDPGGAGGDGGLVPVRLAVYDVAGRLVRTLIDEPRPPGAGAVGWNGTDAAGRRVEAGIYFCRLSAGGTVFSRRMVRLRGLW